MRPSGGITPATDEVPAGAAYPAAFTRITWG